MRQANTAGYVSSADVDRLSKEYFDGPDKPRQIDYLVYLLDEYELNAWCKGAFPDFVAKLRNSQYELTPKQKLSLIRAIKECDAYYDDVKKGFLFRGYADNPAQQRPGSTASSTKMAQANDDSVDDLDEGDIPF